MPDPDTKVQLINVDELIGDTIELLYQIFDLATVDGETSEDGLAHMKHVMDSVPLTQRAVVFGGFLSRLQEEGIDYDPNFFQETVH